MAKEIRVVSYSVIAGRILVKIILKDTLYEYVLPFTKKIEKAIKNDSIHNWNQFRDVVEHNKLSYRRLP